jgi:hypothetical protein
MGDAPTPAESFAESFGKLKSGAQSEAKKFGETKKRTPPAQNTVGSDEKEVPSRWLFQQKLRPPRFAHAADYNSLSAIAEDAEAIDHRPEGGTENGVLMVNRPAAEVLRQTLGDSTAFQGRHIDADDVPQVLDQLENSHPGSPEARQSILSLKDQVGAAAVNDGALEVVVAKEGFGGRRLEKVVATARHELAHRLQDELGGAKGIDGAINWDRFAEHPLVVDAAERVAEMQRKGGQQVTAEDTRHEVPAYIAGGEWDRIGFTLDQAVDVYDHYLKLIEEKHGTDGVDRALVRVHADIRSTIRDTGRSARQEQSATISPGSGGENPRATGEAGRGEAASAGGSHSSLSGGKSSAGGSVPTQSGARTFDPRLGISHLEFFPKASRNETEACSVRRRLAEPRRAASLGARLEEGRQARLARRATAATAVPTLNRTSIPRCASRHLENRSATSASRKRIARFRFVPSLPSRHSRTEGNS